MSVTRDLARMRRAGRLSAATLSLLLLSLAPITTEAQGVASPPAGEAGPRIVEIRPFEARVGTLKVLDSSGREFLEEALFSVVGRNLVQFSGSATTSEEQRTWPGASSRKPAQARLPDYEIKPYYVADPGGTSILAGATLIKHPGAAHLGSWEVNFDTKDQLTGIRPLGLKVGLFLRHELGLHVPSYSLHVQCFSLEGTGVADEMAMNLARRTAIALLNDSELVKAQIIKHPEEMRCGEKGSLQDEQQGQLIIKGILYVRIIPASDAASGQKTVYSFELSLYLGSQPLKPMEPMPCHGWDMLPEMAADRARALVTQLYDLAFIESLLNGFTVQ